jgi:hypothetical protein
MNQRTLELAQQAGLKKDHGSDREYTGDFDWRAFAELLVQECADISNQAEKQCQHPGTQILKHFGIES